MIERLNAEKSDILNQSVHVTEQSEQRQQKIKQLEAVRYHSLFYLPSVSVSIDDDDAEFHISLLSGSISVWISLTLWFNIIKLCQFI